MPLRVLTSGLRAKLAILLAVSVLALAAPVLTSPPDAAAKEEICDWDGGRHPTISYGAEGEAVKHLQCLLNFWRPIFDLPTDQWPHLAVDGVFGDQTETAVYSFQFYWSYKGSFLKDVDGIVGRCTWLAIHPYGKDPGPKCFDTYPT